MDRNFDIPLYEIHSHLGGSIEPEFVGALLARHNNNIRLGKVRKSMTYQGKYPGNFDDFLDKFKLMDQIKWSEKDVYDMVHHVVSNIDRDGIKYSEIRFSLNRYRPFLHIPDHEIIHMIREAFNDACKYFDVVVELVLSIKHTDTADELKVAYDLDKYQECIVGIDVVGDERYFDCDTLRPIYDLWRSNNKVLIAHVGEIKRPEHVRKAIEVLGVHRVAHGIYSDKYTLDMAKERNICFDVALSSNYYTSVVKSSYVNPAVDMIQNGNAVTISTDDRAVFCTALRKEYALAKKYWRLDNDEIDQLKLNAINYSAQNIFNKI